MTLQGIDISSYQTKTPSLVGLSFVICRASIGGDADALYPKHAAAVRKAGLELGAYHFGENESIPVQVSAFIASYQQQQPDFFALDLEGAGPRAMTDAEAAEFLRQFIVRTGRTIGLYGSTSGYPDIGQDWRWVADTRGPKPPIPHDIWQYNDSGPDHDRFEGTLEDFRAVTRGHGSGPNVPGADVKTIQTNFPTGPRTVSFGPGHYEGWNPDGTSKTVTFTVPLSVLHAAGTAMIDQTGHDDVNTPPPHGGPFLAMTDGGLGGLYFREWSEIGDPTAPGPGHAVLGPAAPVFSQADVDNARAAGAEVQWLADSAAVKGAAPA